MSALSFMNLVRASTAPPGPQKDAAPGGAGAVQEELQEKESAATIVPPAGAERKPVAQLPISFVEFRAIKPKGWTTTGERIEVTWSELVERIKHAPTYPEKEAQPLVSFTNRPGDSRAKGTRPTAVTALVVEHDAGRMTLADAALRLRVHGVMSMVFTTASHRADAPRWRIVAPLAAPIAPPDYPALADHMNGILEGVLARESWEVSRCWFAARVDGVPFEATHVEGLPLDELLDLAGASWTPIAKSGTERAEPDEAHQPAAACLTLAQLRAALAVIDPGMGRADWLEVLMALHHETGGSDEGLELAHEWSSHGANFQGREDVEARWLSFGQRAEGPQVTGRTLVHLAARHGVHIGTVATDADFEAIPDDPGEASRDPVAIDWSSLPDDPPAPAFIIPGWLPADAVTLCSAHGGVGKSYLALYLSICLAAGRHPFAADEAIERTRVLFYSAEDPRRVLEWRARNYLRALSLDAAALQGWLEVLDATGHASVLFAGGERGAGRTTSRFDWLARRVERFGAELLVFDNASDALDANENERAKVRQFFNALKNLAPATLLLAHVDALTSMADPATAKGYSGSTAWNNSARSRWFMARDDKTDEVVLALAKCNYGRTGSEARFAWDDAHHVQLLTAVREGRLRAQDYRAVLLGMLHQAIEVEGRRVSPHAQAGNNAFKTLCDRDGFPAGLKPRDVQREVDRWTREGLVELVPYMGSNRNTLPRVAFTDLGRAHAVAAAGAGIGDV